MWKLNFLQIFFLSCMLLRLTSNVFANAVNSHNGSADFGEFCSASLNCKQNFSHLTCNNDTNQCECLHPKHMLYDSERGKCVSLIGSMCRSSLYHSPSEAIDCVTGGICESGLCVCSPFTYLDPKGTGICVPSKNIGFLCSSQVECDSSKKLACLNNGLCGCFSESLEYDRLLDECRLHIGQQCGNMYQIPASPRDKFPMFKIPDNQTEGSDENWQLQRYILRYVEDSFHSLNCHNGSGCDPTTKLCTPCSSSTDVECFCPSDKFLDYNKGKCVALKNYGENCTTSRECSVNFKMLACIRGKCECDPDIGVKNLEQFSVPNDARRDFTFSVNQGVCVGKIGSSCSIKPAGREPSRNYVPHRDNKYCHFNSECDTGVCKCSKDMTPKKNGRCGQGYDKECSLNSPCNDHLVCKSIDSPNKPVMKCRCPNQGQIYDESITSSGCVGNCRWLRLVGETCDNTNITKEGTVVCVKNSECKNKVCSCKEGFANNSLGHCDIGHGHFCDYKAKPELKCDTMAGLQCQIVSRKNSLNDEEIVQICTCPNHDDDLYVGKDRKCVTNGDAYIEEGETCRRNICSVTRKIMKVDDDKPFLSRGQDWCKQSGSN